MSLKNSLKKGAMHNMADCQDLFTSFNSEVSLKTEKKEYLRTSRNAIRDKIKKYFKDSKEVKVPKFHGQGSYMLNTMTNLLDGEFDIDDGVYLQHLDTDETKWPIPATMHGWIVAAVENHTTTSPVDKSTCVRVIYKNDYHVDLPIYVMKDDKPYLAHKSKGWSPSDPKAFIEWFNTKVNNKGEQLKRLVKYFKAWADYQNQNSSIKMPSGMIFTVLASEHFLGSNYRDDEVLVGTARNILDELERNFSVITPVVPSDDLLDGWSDSRKENFINKLKNLCDDGSKALALDDDEKEEASLIWQKLFGARFPKYDPPKKKKEELAKATSAPAILGNHGRSAI
jgi:hypothetical protein